MPYQNQGRNYRNNRSDGGYSSGNRSQYSRKEQEPDKPTFKTLEGPIVVNIEGHDNTWEFSLVESRAGDKPATVFASCTRCYLDQDGKKKFKQTLTIPAKAMSLDEKMDMIFAFASVLEVDIEKELGNPKEQQL